jgi:hypothetical protein
MPYDQGDTVKKETLSLSAGTLDVGVDSESGDQVIYALTLIGKRV